MIWKSMPARSGSWQKNTRRGLADPFVLFRKINDSGKIADVMSSVNHPNKKGHEIIADEIIKWF